MGTVYGIAYNLFQTGSDLWLIAVADRLDQQFSQRAALELELAEHVEDLAAQGMPSPFQLVEKRLIYIPFSGLLGHQVPKMADLRLADSMNATEALLKAIRVPRQVIVHHQVGALKIDAFTRRVGGEQHLDVGIVEERFLSFAAGFAAHAAMYGDDSIRATKQRANTPFQIAERVAVLGEHNKFLMRRRDMARNRAAAMGRRASIRQR